jgi:hypothetical protein
MPVYEKVLRKKIEAISNPEGVLEYLMEEYSQLKSHGPATSDYRKIVRGIRHKYIESLNGNFKREEIRKLIRKYPLDSGD